MATIYGPSPSVSPRSNTGSWHQGNSGLLPRLTTGSPFFHAPLVPAGHIRSNATAVEQAPDARALKWTASGGRGGPPTLPSPGGRRKSLPPRGGGAKKKGRHCPRGGGRGL